MQRRIALDYSNPAEWNEKKLYPRDLNIQSSWLAGYNKSKAFVLQSKLFEIEELDSIDNELTLKSPLDPFSTVGVSENVEDWSQDEVSYSFIIIQISLNVF